MTAEPVFFSYKGSKVAYTTIGNGQPLVILHGWGSSSRAMVPVAKTLESHRTSYLIDLPGFGASAEPPEPWTIDDYADMTEAFITSLGAEKIDLLVHSFGGRITLKLLARNEIAQKIDKVLITGGAGMKPRRSLSYYGKKYLAKTLKAPLMMLPAHLKERSLAKLRQTGLWKSLGSSDYRELTGVMRGTFVQSVTEHLDHLLPMISHDILLLWGREDAATPLYQAQRLKNGLQKSALVIIDDAGHYAFLDKPKQFGAIATAFFIESDEGRVSG